MQVRVRVCVCVCVQERGREGLISLCRLLAWSIGKPRSYRQTETKKTEAQIRKVALEVSATIKTHSPRLMFGKICIRNLEPNYKLLKEIGMR